MSVRVMTAVWSMDLPDSEKIVLLALADCANDEGHCWPSMATLAKKCSKSDRTVQASIKSLVDAGHLTRREVPGKGCNYTIHPRSDCTPEVTAPPKLLLPTPEAAAPPPPKPLRTNRKENHQEPSGGTRKRARSAVFDIPDWIPAEPIAAFLAMRTKKKKPVDSYIAKQLFGRLRSIADAGWNIEDVINKATVNFNDGFWMPDGRDPSIRKAASTALPDDERRERDLKNAEWFDRIGRNDEASDIRRRWGTVASGTPIGELAQRLQRQATT
jgi:Helix-turn-helix domain